MVSGIRTMNGDDIRLLSYYSIPKDWTIHLIDRRSTRKQLEYTQRIIENAQLFAFDTETMPIFYHPLFQHNKLQHANSTALAPALLTYVGKPSLLQVAIRGRGRYAKNVLLFDLQELFDRTNSYFRECQTGAIVHNLIHTIFNHDKAEKLSHSLSSDLAQLKCSYNDDCFHISKLDRLIELSNVYRQGFPDEEYQQTYSLQRMTAMTLNCQLDKSQQRANWSKRPLPQALKDYAAMDVIVMIDIYDRLMGKIKEIYARSIMNNEVDNRSSGLEHDEPIDRIDEDKSDEKKRIKTKQTMSPTTLNSAWATFQQSLEISIDLRQIVVYVCVCGERFMTQKSRGKHARNCVQQIEEQRQAEEAAAQAPILQQQQQTEVHSRKKKPKRTFLNNNAPIKPKVKSPSLEQAHGPVHSESLLDFDLDTSVPCGRGYIPPALRRIYESRSQIPLCEQARCSSAFDEFNLYTENRPPDARFFLEDDDREVARAFGLESLDISLDERCFPIKTTTEHLPIQNSNHPIPIQYKPVMPVKKQQCKIAAYPPKNPVNNSVSSKLNGTSLSNRKPPVDEDNLFDLLEDDSGSPPEFHCHLFGFGGRGHSSSMHIPPPAPSLNGHHFT